MRYLTDRYRPELYYMRGPGPKWLEKHAGRSGAIVVQSDTPEEAATPLRRIEVIMRRWLPMRWRAAHRALMPWDPADQLGPWSV